MEELELKDLHVVYKTRRGNYKAIENVNLNVKKGEFVCLLGVSGCGKTTTLYAIAGLVPISNGKILVDDKPVKGPSANRGMVFQQDAVFPWLTVAQNVAYGPKIKGLRENKRKSIVEHYLKLVGLWSSRTLYPRELSGGMKKRVDLARAFANNPEILLMDEPFGSLDAMTKESLQIATLELWHESHKTVIFVTHDVEEATFLSQRIIIMSQSPGRIEQIVDVPFAYPREVNIKLSPEFTEYRRKLKKKRLR
ncbi:MAG TPA: ABC transporter ATP-binding protein [candidate division CPR3 bacterium]|uniref:ABC transporter ATP-binding protein n=1 Tax=candidate division CPR3 bacterium TaxID=2268181 RepID=A0A7C1SX35_UNCC3|nr:ABC transporter ATP-binding protein [candidate division CPR3 bacterium]